MSSPRSLAIALLALSSCAAFAPNHRQLHPAQQKTIIHLGADADVPLSAPALVIGFGIVLAAAGKLQSDAYTGDRGLGAYLRDGDGYSNSAYKPLKEEPKDPVAAAERLRADLVAAAARGDAARAARLEGELTSLLEANDLEFDAS